MYHLKNKYLLKEFNRSERVSQEIKKELSIILHNKISDPRLKMITISHVSLSRDLSYARIFVTFLNVHKKNINNKLKILNQAKKYMRIILGKKMHFRLVPELFFFHDNTFFESIRISNLFNKINNEEI